MKNFKNIIDLISFFNTEEKCHKFLKSILWNEGKFCPTCGCNKITEFKTNFKRNRCQACGLDFSIKKGTIFDDSKIPLQKWFMAIYLIGSNKKGISSVALAEQIGTTQKTAWFMLHRIRNASNSDLFNETLKNEVEIDEAYFGGKAENMHVSKRIKKKGKFKKTAVLGMVERNGNVKAFKVEDTKANTLKNEIYKNIDKGSIIITDELNAYKGIGQVSYKHLSVNHSKGEYSREEKFESRKNGYKAYKINTNSIEGYWAWVKRGIYGIHHFVSEKHIQKYLNDYSFKYNTKDIENNERFALFLKSVANNKLTYKSLIA